MTYPVRTDPDISRKSVDETVKRVIDFDGPELATGETLSTIVGGVASVSPSGLTISGETIVNRTVQVTCAGGTAGVTYKISVRVTTSGGQTLAGAGLLAVGIT